MWHRWQRSWPWGRSVDHGGAWPDAREVLRSLTSVAGPSGFETAVADTVEEMARGMVDESWRDPLGNLFLRRKSPARPNPGRIMLAAHMDEVGFLVSRIEATGHLRLQTLGRPDVKCLPGQKVEVWGRQKIRGVVGVPAVHLQRAGQKQNELSRDSLFVDTGLEAGQVQELVRPGDVVVLQRRFDDLRHGQVSAPALDNRAGLAVLVGFLQEIGRGCREAEIVGVGTVQEELGARGAGAAAHTLAPDAALVLDVCHGRSPGLAEDETFALGEGPVLTTGPHVHPLLLQWLQQAALRERLRYQWEGDPSPAGTDAFRVQIAEQGVPTALISVPVRYMHTPVETCAIGDLQQAARLVSSWARNLVAGWREELSCW